MEFFNQEYLAEALTHADMFYGVIEYDEIEQANMCIASFLYENDAKEYAAHLKEIGRDAKVVDLLHMQDNAH